MTSFPLITQRRLLTSSLRRTKLYDYCPYMQLSDYEKNTMLKYLGFSDGYYGHLKTILDEWDKSKRWLYSRVFHGSSLIKSKHVNVDLSEDEDSILKAIANESIALVSSVSEWLDFLEQEQRIGHDTNLYILSLFNPEKVRNNEVLTARKLKANGNELQVGGKVMHAIRVALELVGYPHMSLYNEYKDRISVIRTTLKLDTVVYVSIHPLDFLTMSDNNSGWGSCMSMKTRKGSYRSGITEMMNSPMCVIAYTLSKESFPMKGDNGDEYYLPNKSWRQLLFVDSQAKTILGSRQYPFTSKELCRAAMELIAEERFIAGADGMCFSEYPETDWEKDVLKSCDNADVKNSSQSFLKTFEKDVDSYGIVGYTDGACNDFYLFSGFEKFYKGQNKAFNSTYVPIRKVRLSGQATCLHCGSPLEEDRRGTNKIYCRCCEKGGVKD
jgi:hypothetical protein